MHEEYSKTTRCFLDGEPGSGKSTFVKHLCNLWAQSVTQRTDPWPDKHDDSLIARYTIFIVFLLRNVQQGDSVQAMLCKQFPFLCNSEIFAVLNMIDSQSSDIFVILEGLDELPCTTENMILQMVAKKNYQCVHCLSTMRPHCIKTVQRHNIMAIEQHLKLCSFSSEQVEDYIRRFFKRKKDWFGYDSEMISYIKETKPQLEGLAKIPIRLEIMCIVWSQFKNLGDKMVDIYRKLFQCLLRHMERRRGIEEENLTSEEKLMEKYNKLMEDTAKLANSRDKCGKLKLIFHEDDFSRFEQRNNMIELGCMTKESGSSHGGWIFCHQSLQEYLIAYHLSSPDKKEDLDAFVRECRSIRHLISNEMILKCICSLNTEHANYIVQKVVRLQWSEKQCKELLKFILELVPEFTEKHEIDIPLPKFVECDQHISEHEHLGTLFESDEKQKNLQKLKVESMPKCLYYVSRDHIKELLLDIKETDTYACLEVVQKMTGLENVQIHMEHMRNNSMSQILTHIPKEKITNLGISGEELFELAAMVIQNTPNLTKLKIVDTTAPSDGAIEQLSDAIATCDNLTNIHLDVQQLHNKFFLLLKSHAKVSLTVRKVLSESLNNFIPEMKVEDNFFDAICVDPRNYLNNYGKPLGRLIFQLKVLHIPQCNIRHETLMTMGQTIHRLKRVSKTLPQIKELDLSGNDIHGDEQPKYCPDSRGFALGMFLILLPNLETLGLQQCRLSPVVMRNVENILNKKTKIKKLYLAKNGELQEECTEPILSDFWQHFPDLQVLDLNECGITGPSLLGHCKNEGLFELVHLRRLRLNYNYISWCSFQGFARKLPKLEKLEELSLRCSHNIDLKGLLKITEMIPPSLTLLDISENNFGNAIMQIANFKQKMNNLKLLCIGSRFDDDLRVVLEKKIRESNPDISVKYTPDEDERSWDDDIVQSVQEDDEEADFMNFRIEEALQRFMRYDILNLYSE